MSTPPVSSVCRDDIFAERLSLALADNGEYILAETRRDGEVLRFSGRQVDEAVAGIGRGLAALGLETGDCGAILAATDVEWMLADVAMIRSGIISVGIYPTESAARVEYVLRDCGASIVFVDDVEQLSKILAVRSRLPRLRSIVALKPIEGFDALGAMKGFGRAIGFDELSGTAGDWTFPEVLPSDAPAILIYTSGTTGSPKGAVITQANLDAMVGGAIAAYDFEAEWIRPSYLPLCHVAERLFTLCALVCGVRSRFVPDLAILPETLREIRPHHMLGVPRIYEKLLEANSDRAATGARLAEALGLDRARLLLCGGARLPAPLVADYETAGLTIYDIYGMTEVGVVTTNLPKDNRTGSLGREAPGIETKVTTEGELLVRGKAVFSGYLNKPEQTAAALRDGWYHTGDLVTRDDDGHFYILDRKDDMLNTIGGKLVAPAAIETRLCSSPLIAGAVVIGNERKYLTALILLDEAGCRRFALENGLPFDGLEPFCGHPLLVDAVDAAVSVVNHGLSRAEQIKRVHLVAQTFLPTDPEMTPTMKVRRRAFEARYAAAISAMYERERATA